MAFNKIYSLPYIFVFILLFFVTLPIVRINNKSNYTENSSFLYLKYYICFSVFFLFIGLRGFIYSDWISYYHIFNNCPSFFDSKLGVTLAESVRKNNYEIGFVLFTSLVRTFTSNYFVFQFINFLIEFIIIFLFIKEYTNKQTFLGLCFFFIFGCFVINVNLLRNSKSILCFLISIKYIRLRKFIKYLLLIFLGFLFHVSSIIYLPLFFILQKRYRKAFILFLFFAGNIIFLFRIRWITEILQLLPFLGYRLSGMIEFYTKNINSYGITIGYLERFVSFILILRFNEKLLSKNKSNIILINCFYIYIFSYLFLSELTVLIDRIPVLFIFSYWGLYPQLYSLLSRKSKKMFLIIFFSYGILKMYSGNQSIYSKYENSLIYGDNYFERRELVDKYEAQVFGGKK